MTDDAPQKQYLKRFQRVLRHIARHLDEPHSLESTSALAHSSPFHFHRQFTALFGVTITRYVHLERLKVAVTQLAHRPETSVLTISARAGYESPEGFARAFKRELNVTPSDFRRNPTWQRWGHAYAPIRAIKRQLQETLPMPTPVNIIDFPETQLAVLEHRGSHDLLGSSIQKFIGYRRRNRLSPATHATFNLVYDDPNTTAPDAYRMDIGCVSRHPIEANPEGVIAKNIPPGRCARLRCQGGDEALERCLRYLYGEWLPASGETPRDFPLFLQRVTFFPDVPEHETITDIYLPLSAPSPAGSSTV